MCTQDAFKGRWQLSGRTCLPDAPSTLAAMGVKERLITRWVEVHQEDVRQGFTDPSASASASAGPSSMAAANEAGGSAAAAGRSGRQAKGKGSAAAGADADPVPCATAGGFVSLQQRSFFAALNSYADVVLPGRQYPQGDLSAPDWCMDAYLLHALNHISKTADRIKKNNEKIEALVAAGGQRAALEVECRDQVRAQGVKVSSVGQA